MSEDVVLGGARFSWLQNLSDAEILRWPELSPSFPDDIDIVRDQVRGELGAVDVPPSWDGAHSEMRGDIAHDNCGEASPGTDVTHFFSLSPKVGQ
jgi:hypothetical protein